MKCMVRVVKSSQGSVGSILFRAHCTPAHPEELLGLNLRTANRLKETGRKKKNQAIHVLTLAPQQT